MRGGVSSRDKKGWTGRASALALAAALSWIGMDTAHAQTAPPAAAPAEGDVETRLRALQDLVERQDQQLRAQQKALADAQGELARQSRMIAQEHAALATLQAQKDSELAVAVARGTDAPSDPQSSAGGETANPVQLAQNIAVPSQPAPPPPATVGEAPPPKVINAAVLPQGIDILTPPGHVIAETGFSYVQSSDNLLVFRGIEIVPGIEIGAIDANNTNRTQSVAMETIRYGLFPRFEIEALIPYVYGTDRVTEVAERDQQVTETTNLRGSGLGDIEFTGRYQITDGRNGWPILVGNLRVKSDTGTGPFDLKYDQFGAALTLPTGSGFWGVEPSLSMLVTSDPVVIFANLGYLYNFSTNVNKEIGGAQVGEVHPGGSVDASFGFAFALNQRFSFSLGYRESYIRDTTEELNGTLQRSYALQVGALLFGTSYRINDRMTIATNFEIGVTSDAPNITATVRIPIYF